jgi:hypothetical protein
VFRHRDEFGRHAAGGGALAEFEELRDFLPLLWLHFLENFAGALRRQIFEEVRGRVRIHFLDDVGDAVAVERRDDRLADLRIDLLQRFGGNFLVEGFEDRFPFGRRQIPTMSAISAG